MTGVFFWGILKGISRVQTPPRGDFFSMESQDVLAWRILPRCDGKRPSAHQVAGVDTEVQDIWLRVRDHLNDAQETIISSVKGEAEWDTTHGQLFSVLV